MFLPPFTKSAIYIRVTSRHRCENRGLPDSYGRNGLTQSCIGEGDAVTKVFPQEE
jgi:hypothetical protein